MVLPGRDGSGGVHGLAGPGRLDRVGAERAADLGIAAYPRCEHQATDLHETIEGQLGLVSGHLDPDGLLGQSLVVDRVQAHSPDRQPVSRMRLLLLVLEVRPLLDRAGHPELNAARVDQKSHDLVLSGWGSLGSFWPQGQVWTRQA